MVRPGDNNEALRYSLRSLSNLPHGRVFISGYTPKWVTGVVSLNRNQEGVHDLENSNRNLLGALQQSDLSDDFILMMDDVFIMRPIDEVPVCYDRTLGDRVTRYRTGNRFEQAYSLLRTQDWLKKHAPIDRAYLNYEMHFPCVFNKEKLLTVMEEAMNELPLIAIRPRTLYYNYYQIKGQEVNDAKDSTDTENNFISSGRDFATSGTGELIRSCFTDRSTYES